MWVRGIWHGFVLAPCYAVVLAKSKGLGAQVETRVRAPCVIPPHSVSEDALHTLHSVSEDASQPAKSEPQLTSLQGCVTSNAGRGRCKVILVVLVVLKYVVFSLLLLFTPRSLPTPGHHAERAEGMGFCIFNNVAVGAQCGRVCELTTGS